MAFRQQNRLQPARQLAFPVINTDDVQSTTSSQRKRTLQDSQEEWVLFSPSAPSPSIGFTETISDRTPRTAGLSRFSEIGSLDTHAKSEQPEDLTSELQSELIEDDGELDSLDDGLHAFHEPDIGSPRLRMMRSAAAAQEAVFPSHDGIGGFPGLLPPEQRQPPRKQRRRSVVQRTMDALQEADEHDEIEMRNMRNMRIEQWRLDQSRALLEEVERQSRRIQRMTRMASSRSVATASSVNFQTKSEYSFSETDGVATPLVEEPQQLPLMIQQQSQAEVAPLPEDEVPESESFWKKLTRKFIRDVIGVNDEILSVILGDSLPSEEQAATMRAEESQWSPSMTWQERVLSRLARELGMLVNHLSEHPGAFNTYLRTQEPIPFVGVTSPLLPAVPEMEIPDANSSRLLDSPVSYTPSAVFPSTINHTRAHNAVAPNADPSLWGIEEDPEESDPVAAARLRREQEYWEKDLDVGMVYQFLRSRFSSSHAAEIPWSSHARHVDYADDLSTTPTNNSVGLAAASGNPPFLGPSLHANDLLRQNRQRSTPTSHPMPNSLSTASPAMGAPSRTHARAALIRAHHPLARPNQPLARRDSGDELLHSPNLSPGQNTAFSSPKRSLVASRRSNASSCASQSTKKSKLTSSGGRAGGNFWDFAEGSVSSPGWGAAGGDGISI
jgi:hypothetical protein